MPEGDSLHRIARLLAPLVGERVAATSPHPRGRATHVAEATDGRVLEGVDAVGKHLLLRFEDGIQIRSHLRMSGRWRLLPAGAVPGGLPWLVLRTRRGVAVQYNGPELSLTSGRPTGVGPDLLGATDLQLLASRLRARDPAAPIVAAIQDQSLVAGVGNMWASEGLWEVGLSPFEPVGAIADATLLELLGWLRRTMLASVTGGRPSRSVHRRAGRPCRRCGTAIRSLGVGDANRTAYWCPACQGDEPSRG